MFALRNFYCKPELSVFVLTVYLRVVHGCHSDIGRKRFRQHVKKLKIEISLFTKNYCTTEVV